MTDSEKLKILLGGLLSHKLSTTTRLDKLSLLVLLLSNRLLDIDMSSVLFLIEIFGLPENLCISGVTRDT